MQIEGANDAAAAADYTCVGGGGEDSIDAARHSERARIRAGMTV